MKKILKSFTLAAALIIPALIPDAAQAQLFSLKTVPTPEPLDLANYVRDRNAAIQLGKALFWDMQVGSDGVQACGTCHFHAGADTRTQNQLNPGTLGGDTLFGNNRLGLPSPASIGAPQNFKPNAKLTKNHFPFHKVANKDISADPANPFFNPAGLVSDTNDVASSMGVERRQFIDIVPGNPVDLSTPQSDQVFQLAGQNMRRVAPRNTASVVNAVFNFSNFWDGRANNIFNGHTPFGPADPREHAIVDVNGSLDEQLVRLRHSSLASQAVGPPLSDFEMSWQGRTFPKVGKKMLSLRPLAQQKVHPQDSVLGPLANTVAGTGLTASYAEMIRKAFPPRFWKNTSWHVIYLPDGSAQFQPGPPQNTDEYTQMEANFSLFFGLAIQQYEASLVANNSRLDLFLEGAGSLTAQEQRGMVIFNGPGGCAVCHAGGELTDHTATLIQGASPITNFPQPLNKNPLGANDFMSLFTGLGLYDQGFHNNGVRPGGATDPAAPEYLAVNEDLGRGGNTDLPAPLENFPLGFGRLGMRNIGFEDPPLPLFLSAYVPPLPFGFRHIDTFPYPGRVANFGTFKTPGLRNVELTGPYMHNGGFATLRQVVELYVRGGDFPYTNAMDFDVGVLPIGFLTGSESRKQDLIAFLLTMTDERVRQEAAPFDHPEIFVPVDGRAPVTPGTRAGLLAASTMFKQIPAVGSGGLSAESLPPIGTFLALSPYYSGANLSVAPVPANDTASVIQNTVKVINVTANDAYCNTDMPCTVTVASPPASGAAIANLPANGQVQYTPASGFTGTDSFSYTATNAGGTSATTGIVTVNVVLSSEPPAAVNDSFSAIATIAKRFNVLANDTDPDGPADLVGVTNVTQPQAGAFVTVVNGRDARFLATVPGAYSFTYQAMDAAENISANTATVTVKVLADTVTIAANSYTLGTSTLTASGKVSPAAGQKVTLRFFDAAGNMLERIDDFSTDADGNWTAVKEIALPAGATMLRAATSNGSVRQTAINFQ